MSSNPHVSARDRQLSPVSLTIGVVCWLAGLIVIVRAGGVPVVLGLTAAILLIAAILFVSYLVAHLSLLAHLRGQGIEVTPHQLPELHEQLESCCQTLGVDKTPRLFILNGNGVLNAFTAWFLSRRLIILNSDIVDATDGNPAGVRFYIGHELGHVLRHDHPVIGVLRWPALRLPLLGAAYARARETTCDLHGLACCPDRESAARSVAVLAAGKRQWAALSMEGARLQALAGTGFWMSLMELVSGYPWTAKRTVRVLDETPELPTRNPLAYVIAAFVPYAGQVNAFVGVLIYAYVIGIGAAIAIPAYQNYTIRAQLTQADGDATQVKTALGDYYLRTHQVPATLEAVGLSANRVIPMPKNAPPLLLTYSLQSQTMTVAVQVGPTGPRGERFGLVYVPRRAPDGQILWSCAGLDGTKKEQLPATCAP
jgi:Zn-dependent protease with chaperone function/type II secretory pathway pseudopilin PulG